MAELAIPFRRLLQRAAVSKADIRDLPSPWFAERMALYFSALFLIYGVHITYFPVWPWFRSVRKRVASSAEFVATIPASPYAPRFFVG